MKNKPWLYILILTFTCIVAVTVVYAWGFWGHKRINRMAVFTLPPEMIGFYKRNIEFITEHAVDPDKRRYANKDEAPRHYIDIDHYGENAFDSMPQFWNEAVKKYTEDTLKAYGIVPWYVTKQLSMLTNAFKEMDIERILRYSADIGHYVADAHVPLHTTENYNGQLTNQVGIHGFWESRIPELEGDNYDYFTGRATYIEKPQQYIWKVIKVSHTAVDSVLKMEARLNSTFDQDKKYTIEQRGTTSMKVYSEEYSKAYNKMLNGMIERRLREAITAVGSMWFTAWVNAGKPNLDSLQNVVLSEDYKKQMEEEDRMWKTGKPPASIKGHAD